jgi:hypothetical protein
LREPIKLPPTISTSKTITPKTISTPFMICLSP